MKMTIALASVLGLGALVGCGGGGGGFDDLYAAPTGSATGALYGVWGGTYQVFDTRWVLGSDELTLANKCGNTIVGVTVSARVSDTEISILESDHDGGESCAVNAVPGTFTVCSDDPFVPKDTCFVHAGTSLTLYESDVDYIELTKLED